MHAMVQIIKILLFEVNSNKDGPRQYNSNQLQIRKTANNHKELLHGCNRIKTYGKIRIPGHTGTAQNGTVLPFIGYLKSVIMSFPTKR
jgi:hypothetical protein